MAKRQFVHAACASGLTIFILPALAEDSQGVVMTLDFKQRFEAGDNLSLDFPEEGNTTLSTTSLTFGLTSETNNQSLSFSLGGKIRAGEIPSGSEIDTGFVEPNLRFAYQREGANALLNVDGRYDESDISFRPAVSDFADPTTGVIVLPPDFEDLRGSGQRQSYNLDTSLETGIGAPLGLVFTAGVSGITYDQQTASLSDVFRYSAGVRANLRVSEVTTTFAAYNLSHYEAEDTQNTERDTNAIEIGFVQELSDISTIEAAIGFSETDESLNGISTTTSGATGRLSLIHGLPNGNVTASYSTSRDQDGARHNVSVGRSLELPRGNLSATIGATSKDGSDPALIGSLVFNQDLPTGNLRLGINRNVSISNEDEERVTTTADMAYNYDINNLSSIGLDLSFGLSEGNTTAEETQRSDVSASYNYKLTEDWRLSTGVTYKIRDSDTQGKSDSTSIFVSLERDFTFFP